MPQRNPAPPRSQPRQARPEASNIQGWGVPKQQQSDEFLISRLRAIREGMRGRPGARCAGPFRAYEGRVCDVDCARDLALKNGRRDGQKQRRLCERELARLVLQSMFWPGAAHRLAVSGFGAAVFSGRSGHGWETASAGNSRNTRLASADLAASMAPNLMRFCQCSSLGASKAHRSSRLK